MLEHAFIVIPVALLVVVFSCIFCTSRVLNSAAHSKRLSESAPTVSLLALYRCRVCSRWLHARKAASGGKSAANQMDTHIAAERFARALKEEAKRQPSISFCSTLPPIIPHLILQPDASLLLGVSDKLNSAASSPRTSADRAQSVPAVVQQRFPVPTQEPLQTETAATGQPAVVGADAPVEGVENFESVRATAFSPSSSLALDQQQSTEAATSFKTAADSLSQASFGGAQQFYGPDGGPPSHPRSTSAGVPCDTLLSTRELPPPTVAPLALLPSSIEAPESPAFSTASSELSSDREMLPGHSHKNRRHSQPSLGAISPNSSPSARSTSSKGAGQHSSGVLRPRRSASTISSPLQHSHAAQSSTTVPSPHAQLLDSSSSQGSLAQPGTASSSFAHSVSGRSSSRRSQSGLPVQQYSQESVHSIPGPWGSMQRSVASTSEMELIPQGIGSREASPPVSALPPAVAAAQARAAQAATFQGQTLAVSDSGPSSFRRFSTGSVLGNPQSTCEVQQDEESEILPAEGQQRRATVSSGVSLADQIERALHAASSSKSTTPEPQSTAARPPLAPRKERVAGPVSKGSIRRKRLLEAMALIGRPLVPGVDDANDVAAASSSGLVPVASSSDGSSELHLGGASSSSGQHMRSVSPTGDAWELGVINEHSRAGSSSRATHTGLSEHARSSQDSQRTSSPSSSQHLRNRTLSGERSVSSVAHAVAAVGSNSSPLRLSHEVMRDSRRTAVHAQTQTHSSDAFSEMEHLYSEAGSTSAFSAALSREHLPAVSGELSHSSRVAAATASAVAAAATVHEAAIGIKAQPQPLVPEPYAWPDMHRQPDEAHEVLERQHVGSFQEHAQSDIMGSQVGPSEPRISHQRPAVEAQQCRVSALANLFEPTGVTTSQQVVEESDATSRTFDKHVHSDVAKVPAAVESASVEHTHAGTSHQGSVDVLETSSTGVCLAAAQALAATPPNQVTSSQEVPHATASGYSTAPPRSNDGIAVITPMCERVRPSKTPSLASTCTSHPPAPASLASVAASIASAPVGAAPSSYYSDAPDSSGKEPRGEKVAKSPSLASTHSMPARPVTSQPAPDRKSCSRPITARAFYRSGRPSRTVRVHLQNTGGPLQSASSSQRMHVPGWVMSPSTSQASLCTRGSETARHTDARLPSAFIGGGVHASVVSASSADVGSQDDEWGQFAHQNTAAMRTPRFASPSQQSSQSDMGPSDIDSARFGGDTPQSGPTHTEADGTSRVDAEATSASNEVLGVRRHVFSGHTMPASSDIILAVPSMLQGTSDSLRSGHNRQLEAAEAARQSEDHVSNEAIGELASSVVLNAPSTSAAALLQGSQQVSHAGQVPSEHMGQGALADDLTGPLSLSGTPTQSVTLTPSLEDSAGALENWQQRSEQQTSEASEATSHVPELWLDPGTSDVGLQSAEVSDAQSVPQTLNTNNVPQEGALEGTPAPAAGYPPPSPLGRGAQLEVAPSGPESVYLSPRTLDEVSEAAPAGDEQNPASVAEEQASFGPPAAEAHASFGHTVNQDSPEAQCAVHSATSAGGTSAVGSTAVYRQAVRAVAVGSKGADSDMRIVSAVLPSSHMTREGLSGTATTVLRTGGPRGAERDAAAVTELDDAFSALAAAAQEIQHALEVSEEDAWQSAAARDAQMLHNDLMFAAAHAEMAEPRATIEGEQEDAHSDVWSTGSSCGGDVVQVVHEGWGSGDLPEATTMPAFVGDGMADAGGMEGYPQVPVDAHLSGRRREFAPLDSWVPVAMETIVEEDCDAEAVESYKCRERTYTFSVVTAEADAHAHMYETVPSYRNQAQSSAQSSEDSTFEPLGEPCWVDEEGRGNQLAANTPSFEAPHPASMLPSPGPSTATVSSSFSPPETAAVQQVSPAVSSDQIFSAPVYPAPQVPVTSPSLPQMPVSASPATDSTFSHTPGKIDTSSVDRAAGEQRRTAAMLTVPSLMIDHIRSDGASSIGGSTAGSNPGSARRIVPSAVTSWLESPEQFTSKHDSVVRMRRGSDGGAALGPQQSAVSDSSSRPRTLSDIGSDMRSGMFRPRGAGSGSVRSSATWSSCAMEQPVDRVQLTGSWEDGSVHDSEEAPSGADCGEQLEGSLLLPQPPEHTSFTDLAGPVGEGIEDSDDICDLPLIDLQPFPARPRPAVRRPPMQAKPMDQHRSSLPPRLQGHVAGMGARSRFCGEDNSLNRMFKAGQSEVFFAAPVYPKQPALSSIRQPAPTLESLPEDPAEGSSSSMSELKRRVQAAAASARESTHLVPPLQQQAWVSPQSDANMYIPASPPESGGALETPPHVDVCETWPAAQPDSSASERHDMQEITLALPYPSSSAVTWSGAIPASDSARIKGEPSGSITVAPASLGIPSLAASPPTDAAPQSSSCDSVSLNVDDFYAVHRTRPASISWSACSDLFEESVRTVSRAGSSVRSGSRSHSVSVFSRPVSHASAASLQGAPQPQTWSPVGITAFTKPVAQYQRASALHVLFSRDQSAHGGRVAPQCMSSASERAPDEAHQLAPMYCMPSSIEEEGAQAAMAPTNGRHTDHLSPIVNRNEVACRPQSPSPRARGAVAHTPRGGSAALRLTRAGRTRVHKQSPNGVSGHGKSSVLGHRANTLERWMAAAQEAVHLMTLPDNARRARMHDLYDDLPAGVEWVVVGVEPGHSALLDKQLLKPSPALPAGSRPGARSWRGSHSCQGRQSERAHVEQDVSAASEGVQVDVMVLP